MSNTDLKNRLSQLKGRLHILESHNRKLRSDLSDIASTARSIRNTVEKYSSSVVGTLSNCDTRLHSAQQRLDDAVAVQGEIEHLYACYKQKELAYKRIREANNTKYYDFASYRTVRRIVQGIMDNLDLTMVCDAVIARSVERQHLMSPDYWLTCVLISIMAWKNDDRELADRAMERALYLDKKRSAVFYMLFNLRMKREEAAIKWFDTYQECEFTGADQRTFLMLFSLVSRSLSDTVAESTKSEIHAFIRKVVQANMASSGYSEEAAIEQIVGYFRRMKPSDPLEYGALRKYCSDFDDLTDIMMEAGNNLNILEFILRTTNVPPAQKNTFLKGFIDELIEAPNQTEQDVYESIAYNQTIIDCDGEIEQAKEVYAAAKARKERELDLVSEMIDWIYERNASEVNGQIRLSMFTLTKDLQEKAVDAHVEGYRSRIRSEHPVTIGEYSTTVDFDREEEEHRKIEAHFTAKRDEAMAAIKPTAAWVAFGVSAAAAVSAFVWSWALLAISLCGVGFGAITLLSNKNQLKKLELDCAIQIKSTEDIFRLLFAEYRQYLTEFEEYDDYYHRIQDAFSKI